MQFIEVQRSQFQSQEDLRQQIKLASFIAGLQGKPVVLFVPEDVNDESMQDICSLMCEGKFHNELAVASWLVRSTPDRVERVRVLAGNIVLCSWERQFTLTVPLSIQVYKWVPANLMLGVTLRWTGIPSMGK